MAKQRVSRVFEGLESRSLLSSVTSFSLIDASRDLVVPGYEHLRGDVSVAKSSLPGSVSVRANVDAPDTVVFDYNGTSNFRTETVAPYALFGDSSGDYAGRDLAPGLHTVTGRTSSGTPLTLRFH